MSKTLDIFNYDQKYKVNYHPIYTIMLQRYRDYFSLWQRLNRLLNKFSNLIINEVVLVTR